MSSIWKIHLKTFLQDPNEQKLEAQLLACWSETFPEDKFEIYQFIIANGALPTFIKLILIDLRTQPTEVPWLLFFHVIDREQVNIPDKVIDQAINLLKKFDLIPTGTSSFEPLLKLLEKNQKNHFLKTVQMKKHELLTSARIAKSENLMSKHLQYMNELRKLFPSDYNLTNLISEQEINKAQSVLARRSRKKAKPTPRTITTEDSELLSKLRTQAHNFLQKNQDLASDFAYLLRTSDDFEGAIEILNKQDESTTKDWQLLEYLYSGNQYLSTLGHCSVLKEKYKGDADSQFSISYYEALSYWELGEKNKALEIMSQISSMRPQFKSATETLNHWKADTYE